MKKGRVESPAKVVADGPRPRLGVAALGLVFALVCLSCGGRPNTSATGTLQSLEATPANLALIAGASDAGEPATIDIGDPSSDGDPGQDAETDLVTGEDVVPDGGDEEVVLANEPVGPPLPPLSTAVQVLEVVSDVHGPTVDVAAQMNRLVDFPDIPTPTGSRITEVRADVRESIDGGGLVITAEVLLDSTDTVDDLLDFYESGLGDLGWDPTIVSGVGLGQARIESRGFALGNSPSGQSDLHIDFQKLKTESVEGQGDPEERSSVRLRFVELAENEDSTPRSRFEGWIGELPLPEGGVVTGAAIQTSNVGRHSLHYSLALRYDSVEVEEIAEELRDALPAGDYRVRPQPPTGDVLDSWVYLEHPFFVDARVSPHAIDPATPSLGSVVNVDARIEFSPTR